MTALRGGATGSVYKSRRAKGPKPDHHFQRKTLALLEQVDAVLAEFAKDDLLPMTPRQVFYRLVGAYGYEKTQRAADRLGNHLVNARRSGRLPWDAFTDERVASSTPHAFASVGAFWSDTLARAERYRAERADGQPYVVEVWAEAAGMVPQLSRVAHGYGAAVFGWGGQPGVAPKRDAAARIAARDRPTVALVIGDMDEHGNCVMDAVHDDVVAFLAADNAADRFVYRHLAVTLAQVMAYGLDTKPPKPSKNDATKPGPPLPWTVQAEALRADALAGILRSALDEWTEPEARRAVLAREADERAQAVDEVRRAVVSLDYEWDDGE